MGYYTIWLAPVNGILVPFWELGEGGLPVDAWGGEFEQMAVGSLE